MQGPASAARSPVAIALPCRASLQHVEREDDKGVSSPCSLTLAHPLVQSRAEMVEKRGGCQAMGQNCCFTVRRWGRCPVRSRRSGSAGSPGMWRSGCTARALRQARCRGHMCVEGCNKVQCLQLQRRSWQSLPLGHHASRQAKAQPSRAEHPPECGAR